MDTSTPNPYTPTKVIARLAFGTLAALLPAVLVVSTAATTDRIAPPPEVELVTSVGYYVARSETSEELEQAAEPSGGGSRTFPWPRP